jgi:replication factor A2
MCFSQITLVGQVVRKTIQSTNVELEIDDSTGKIGVRMWLDLDDSGQEGDNSKTRTPWERGDYVRVIGNLRSFNNNRNVVAFRVQPVANFNEITYHLLDVIHVHLYNTKGPLETPQLQTQQAETETANRGGPGKSGAQPRPQGYGQSASRTRSQFTPLQKAIMDVISSSGKPKTGCSVGEICAALKNFGTENDVREAIEFLNAEGHLYSTIDEEHYRCADDSGN